MASKLWNKLWCRDAEWEGKTEMEDKERGGGWGGGGEEMLWGLPFLNIIKTYLFCVPHQEHPCPVTEVGRSTQSQAHPALHGWD